MDWITPRDDQDIIDRGLPGHGEGPVTKMDASAEKIHGELRKVRDYQVSEIKYVWKF